MDEWYRNQLKEIVTPLIAMWEKRMKVRVAGFGIRRMKTKWGSCNTESEQILFNLELAKKPVDCIEYIVVHEMLHLLVRRHNDQFITCMHKLLPGWVNSRIKLNRSVLAGNSA
jgi:Predicted metal-dependent hydrolase